MSEPAPDIVPQPAPPKRSFPRRFSLSSLCVVVAVACVAAAWYGMRRRERAAVQRAATLAETVKKQQEEISRLRGELGYLTITDRGKVHIIQLDAREDYHWRWRVYLPPGKKWSLCEAFGRVPPLGYENMQHGWSSIPEGEHTIEVYFDRDENGQRRFVVRRGTGRTSMTVDDDQFEQLISAGYSTSTAGSSKTELSDVGGPIQLIRLRAHRELPGGPPGARSFVTSDDPEPGFVVWLE